MTQTPVLTDLTALSRNRARVDASALFLHEDLADEVQERLIEVNRTFKSPAIVCPYPGIWAERLPDATIVPENETLELRQGAHDLVIHFLCLHWSNDPVGQLIQCRRALKPDGLLIATLFGGSTLSELRDALTRAEIEIAGGLSPRIVPMGEIRDLGALLNRAGLSLPVADTHKRTVLYSSTTKLFNDLRGMGERNALTARHRRPAPRKLFERTAELYHEAYAGADDRIPATFEVITLTGWAPHESQPRPLRPGSAEARLADALNTTENALKND